MNWHTVLAIDFDKWAARTYAANFPETRVECGPVSDFIDTLPTADLVLGGPPCQPHSHAGKRGASADARDCGPDFVAAIAKVKPRMFLMENVPGLLTSEDGRYWHKLYAAMEDAGYVCQYRVQDAVALGVPQFRDRLWVWGIRRDVYAAGVRHRWPVPTHAWPPPQGECLFGANLLAGVTVRQAHPLVGVADAYRDGAGNSGLLGSNPNRPLPVDDACEPAHPLVIGHGRKRMNGGANRLYSSHLVLLLDLQPQRPEQVIQLVARKLFAPRDVVVNVAAVNVRRDRQGQLVRGHALPCHRGDDGRSDVHHLPPRLQPSFNDGAGGGHEIARGLNAGLAPTVAQVAPYLLRVAERVGVNGFGHVGEGRHVGGKLAGGDEAEDVGLDGFGQLFHGGQCVCHARIVSTGSGHVKPCPRAIATAAESPTLFTEVRNK